jgi:hypothetical protein
MKHEAKQTSGSVKEISLPGNTIKPTTPWGKIDKQQDTPAPPPVWTRYIDSRLKQFCVR